MERTLCLPRSEPGSVQVQGQWFTTTHWSVVLAAKAPTPVAMEALEQLCRTYWPPLYAYIRREGYQAEDAQDLTQEFLSRLVHKEWLSRLQDQRGKFRSFLLTFLKHFLSDQRDRARAQKRGAGITPVSLDLLEAEAGYAGIAVETLTPDQVFERKWVQTLLGRAIERLAEEYAAAGKGELYERLHSLENADVGYAEIGVQLGLSEGAVKSAVHRLRQRHREILREEIAHTVSNPSEVEEEIRYFLAVLGA